MSGDRTTLVATARLYGDAVAIVDPLRARLWAECGLTVPQLRLMFMLREEPGSTGSVLAERFGVNPSTITGHVEKLMQRELVWREEDEQDRRVQHNYLTELGADLTGRLERAAGEYVITILSRLSSAQVQRLHDALDDLVMAARAEAVAVRAD
jgi:DNA-binding MarR family transcriptional regulator